MFANVKENKTLDPFVAFWIVFFVALIVWNIVSVHRALITTLAIIITILIIIRVFYWKKIKQTLTLFSLQKELMEALDKGDFEKVMKIYPKLMEALPEEYKKNLPFGNLDISNPEKIDLDKLMQSNPLLESLMKDLFKETKKKK